jgi:SIR2-like domain
LASLLSYLPRPLLDQIISGRCVPVIGAGFSRNAVTADGSAPPLWNELGAAIAKDLRDYEPSGAVDAISAFEGQYSRRALVEALTRLLLVGTATPGLAHRAFCEVPFDLVVTTNFDFLLELGYSAAQRYCRPILNEDELGIDAVSPRVDLIKLHGDLHHSERMIVTEEDYDAFLTRYPLMATFIANLLISKTALFIGYSLEDYDFRQIWQLIKDRLGRMRREAYTITIGASAHEMARFERRGVHVVNLPGSQKRAGVVYSQLFNELRIAWTNAIPKHSIVTEEESLAELSVPPGGANRLCFFSLPVSLVALYREIIFPIAQDAGFVPISAVDVISQGDSITAKVTALIERSQLLVFDLSSEATYREFALAFSRWPISATELLDVDGERASLDPSRVRASSDVNRARRTLIVLPEGVTLPYAIESQRIIRSVWRPAEISASNDRFLVEVREFFANAAEQFREDYESEPEKLLDERHPTAAVITAFTLFERELRSRFDRGSGRRMNIRDLLDSAHRANIAGDDEWKKVLESVDLRNRLVHGEVPSVDLRRARSVVSLLLRLTRKVREWG